MASRCWNAGASAGDPDCRSDDDDSGAHGHGATRGRGHARRADEAASSPHLRWLVLAAVVALGGCAVRGSHTSESVDSPDRVALARLQTGGPDKLAVGHAPIEGAQLPLDRMNQALHDALVRDLGAIGVLDAAARTRVDAVVLRSGGRVEALITVTRAGQTRLKKRYPVDAPTEPADPSNAIRPLLGLLYSDPEFDLSIRP